MTKKYPKYNEHEFIQKCYANRHFNGITQSKHYALSPIFKKTQFYRVSYN